MGSFPGKPSFRGLGELTADELETLWPERRRANSETLAAAAEAWDAFRAPEPSALAELAHSAGSPSCHSSLRRSSACSRSFPLPVTVSPAPSGAR